MDNIKSELQEIHEQAEQVAALLWVLSTSFSDGGLGENVYESATIHLANMSTDIAAAIKNLEVKLNGEQAQG